MELAGDPFKRTIYAKIGIQNRWLAGLGFRPTGRVWIVSQVPGDLILRYYEP